MAAKFETTDAPEQVGSSRREFLFQMVGMAGLAAGAAIGSGVTFDVQAKKNKGAQLAPGYFLDQKTRKSRRKNQYKLKLNMAKASFKSPMVPLTTNGDEENLLTRVGNFTKSLPHGHDGMVDPGAYDALLRACTAGTPEAFEAVPGGPTQLKNPLAAYAYTLEGPDPFDTFLPPPPSFASAETAAEMVENYWHALLRDVPFTDYDTSPWVRVACSDIGRLPGYRGPRAGDGSVTPGTLFRSLGQQVTNGPYISQFLLKDMLFGHTFIPQKYTTAPPGSDFITTRDEWLAIQRGGFSPHAQPLGETRYITTGRDLAQMVHVDFPFETPLVAALNLIAMKAPAHPADPYYALRRQCGFVSFGQAQITEAVARVNTLALRHAWRHKWTLHRRTRPEEYAARVHDFILLGAHQHPIHPDLLNSLALTETFSKWGSYLLPQAYPEGCPCHPAYPSGHATFVGAGITMLKAFFNENHIIPDPVVPSPDGQSLLPYHGPPLTVGGELNKLASNVSMGRDFAGVHWRSDAWEGNLLGERVAVELLRELKTCYAENFHAQFTGLGGAPIRI